jgi:hypothetical protein
MVNDGWHIQAAMGERGLDAIDPRNAGRRRFLFVVQEAPFPTRCRSWRSAPTR